MSKNRVPTGMDVRDIWVHTDDGGVTLRMPVDALYESDITTALNTWLGDTRPRNENADGGTAGKPRHLDWSEIAGRPRTLFGGRAEPLLQENGECALPEELEQYRLDERHRPRVGRVVGLPVASLRSTAGNLLLTERSDGVHEERVAIELGKPINGERTMVVNGNNFNWEATIPVQSFEQDKDLRLWLDEIKFSNNASLDEIDIHLGKLTAQGSVRILWDSGKPVLPACLRKHIREQAA